MAALIWHWRRREFNCHIIYRCFCEIYLFIMNVFRVRWVLFVNAFVYEIDYTYRRDMVTFLAVGKISVAFTKKTCNFNDMGMEYRAADSKVACLEPTKWNQNIQINYHLVKTVKETIVRHPQMGFLKVCIYSEKSYVFILCCYYSLLL